MRNYKSFTVLRCTRRVLIVYALLNLGGAWLWVTRNEEKVEMAALLVMLVCCNLLLLGVEGNTNTLDRKVLDYLYKRHV